jgi:tetratricopeptide (TPR) repeat protein
MVDTALSRAAAGEGGLIVISGEPGIGKTSLLRHLRSSAQSESFIVLNVGSALPNTPNKEIVWKRIWSELCQRHALARLAPDGNETLLAQFSEGYSPSAFQTIIEAAQRLSGESPLLITVDDIHQVDKASLELLGLLADSFESLRAILAVAYNPSAMAGRTEAGWAVELMASRGRSVEIAGVDEDATKQILEQVASFTPDERIVRSVRHLTGGNPRFVLACGSVVSDLNRLRVSHGSRIRIPGTIRAAIIERLKPLSLAAKKVAQVGALFRAGFESNLIYRLANLSTTELHKAVVELENAGLIVSLTDETFDFRHGFTRELLYRDMPVDKRSYLHSRIANILEMDGSQLNGKAVQISEHLIGSGQPRNLEQAIHYAQDAAVHLAARRQFSSSAEMYSTAVSAAEALPGFDRARLCRMLIALGEVQRQAWDIEAAQQTFARAARLAQDLSDNGQLAQIALKLPDLGWPLGSAMNATALMIAEKALAAIPKGDSTQKTLLFARVAAELSYIPDRRTSSEQLFNEAVEMGRRLVGEDKSVMWCIYQFRDRMLRRPHLTQERLNNAELMNQLAYGARADDVLFVSDLIKFCVFCELGDCASADMQMLLMQQRTEMLDRPEYRILLLYLRAGVASHRGRFGLALDLCNEASEVAHENGLLSLAATYWPCLILPLREHGRLEELARAAEDAFAMESCFYASRAVACWVAFQLGDTAQARWQLDVLAAYKFRELVEAPCSLAAAALLADVSVGLKMTYTGQLYELLLPFKDRMVIFEPGFLSFGSVSLYLGKLALAHSQPELAVQYFEEAVASDRKTAGRTWLGYSLLELARSLLARRAPGDHERASEILAIAGAEAATLAMHVLGEKVSELATAGPPTSTVRGLLFDDKSISRAVEWSGTAPSEATASLRREGVGWELTFEGLTVHLKALRGLSLIAHLLSRPNEAISAFELAILGKNGELAESPSLPSDLGPMLDKDAKSAYRARIRHLGQELDEARSSGNQETTLQLEKELRFLTREIARAVGLFGRDRRNGSHSERARVQVTSSIKFAIRKIAENHPMFGSYLQRTIRTGGLCSYTPELGVRIIQEF